MNQPPSVLNLGRGNSAEATTSKGSVKRIQRRGLIASQYQNLESSEDAKIQLGAVRLPVVELSKQVKEEMKIEKMKEQSRADRV